LGRHRPDLADQIRIRADRPTALSEFLPEGLVVDLTRDVQSPAIDPEAEPVFGDPEQVLADLRLVRVQLGQGGQAPPRLVAQGLRRRAGG
jgi:hypothetical protein